jgi:hypothetical protein
MDPDSEDSEDALTPEMKQLQVGHVKTLCGATGAVVLVPRWHCLVQACQESTYTISHLLAISRAELAIHALIHGHTRPAVGFWTFPPSPLVAAKEEEILSIVWHAMSTGQVRPRVISTTSSRFCE